MDDDLKKNLLQRKFWSGDFGNSYITRNLKNPDQIYDGNITIENIFEEFFQNMDKSSKILELGCNIGLKLSLLHKMGFSDLSGVELNETAFNAAKKNNPSIKFYNSSIEKFEPSEGEYDLVFTSGVLIHINPNSINLILDKIVNLSKKYIFGFEYFSEKLEEITYRGHSNVLWKQNFPLLFTQRFPDISVVKQEKFFYQNSNLCDIAYLLKKT
jgi:pseudaminic acid biosynthesis-associated methylase